MPSLLETFPNPQPERPFLICHIAEEFTSLCPKTGQPDFGRVFLNYVPDAVCIELKSWKLYLQSFRNEGIFYEAVSNRLLDDAVAACAPRWLRLETVWTVRGGIHSHIVCEHSPAGRPETITIPPLQCP